MLADWWDTATLEERTALLAIPGLRASGVTAAHPFDDCVRDALIEVLMRSGSDLVVFPLQDLFGWRDRINVPATVDPTNWSWASPIPVDRLMDDAASRARTETLRAIVARDGSRQGRRDAYAPRLMTAYRQRRTPAATGRKP